MGLCNTKSLTEWFILAFIGNMILCFLLLFLQIYGLKIREHKLKWTPKITA